MDLKIENKYGEQLTLTNHLDYQLLQVTGLTPPAASINISTNALADGGTYNSSRLSTRNITLTIAPSNNVESSRVNLYRYIKSKQYIKLYITTASRDVWIDGYVESIEGDLYENPQKIMASIICPDPYFKSSNNIVIDFSSVASAFEFPYEPIAQGKPVSTLALLDDIDVYNPSDDDTGAVFNLHAKSTVLEPSIYNQTMNEHMTIKCEMQEGDRIVLNTKRGQKSIELIRNGVTTNIINDIAQGSKWLQVLTGYNVFNYTCVHGTEALAVSMSLDAIYEGV